MLKDKEALKAVLKGGAEDTRALAAQAAGKTKLAAGQASARVAASVASARTAAALRRADKHNAPREGGGGDDEGTALASAQAADPEAPPAPKLSGDSGLFGFLGKAPAAAPEGARRPAAPSRRPLPLPPPAPRPPPPPQSITRWAVRRAPTIPPPAPARSLRAHAPAPARRRWQPPLPRATRRSGSSSRR